MVLELLGALAGAVAVPHGDRPDASGDPAEHRVLGVHAVGEEEAEVGGEVVDVEAAGQVRLDVGEPVGQGERQLADRVRARLGDVVAGDGHRVEVAHPLGDEPLGHVRHESERELGGEDAGVLALVLLEDVGLHRASDVGERPGAQLGGFVVGGRPALLLGEAVDALVDDGVEEHGEHGRSRAVDGHRHRRRRVAQVEARVEDPHVVERRDRHAGVADLAVDVGPLGRVAAVEGDRVERGRQSGGGLAFRQQVEAAVGARRAALAGEHAGRVLALALEREHPGGERERARQVLRAQPPELLAVVDEAGERQLGDCGARQRFAGRAVGSGQLGRALGPPFEQLAVRVGELGAGGLGEGGHRVGNSTVAVAAVGEHGCGGLELLEPAGRRRVAGGGVVVAADGLGDLGQVARTGLGDDRVQARRRTGVDRGQGSLADAQAVAGELPAEVLVQGGDAVVVEPGRDRAEHRHVGRVPVERLAVADHLAGDVAEGVLGASTFELVDRHRVGEVEHVDLLQLRRGAELGGHHVQRHVGDGGDLRVALADAGGLDDDQVGAGGHGGLDHPVQVQGYLSAGVAGGEGPEVHRGGVDGVHADPVAEQRPAAAAPGRVDGEHRDVDLVVLVEADPSDELVGQRGLARAAGAGDSEHRHRPRPSRGGDLLDGRRVEAVGLEHGDRAGQCRDGPAEQVLDRGGLVGQVDVALGDQGVDHAGQAHALAVLGGEDAHAEGPQRRDLLGDDDAAAAPVDPDVSGARGGEPVDQVAEELDVAALVAADRDALDVFGDGGLDHLVDRAVVAQVDHLCALRLQDAPHDVDRGVVAVEQARGGDEADRVNRSVELDGHVWSPRQMFGRPHISGDGLRVERRRAIASRRCGSGGPSVSTRSTRPGASGSTGGGRTRRAEWPR